MGMMGIEEMKCSLYCYCYYCYCCCYSDVNLKNPPIDPRKKEALVAHLFLKEMNFFCSDYVYGNLNDGHSDGIYLVYPAVWVRTRKEECSEEPA